MKQFPWAYYLPSLKRSRRLFMIRVAPEIAPLLHRDALNHFILVICRVLLSPIWVPLVVLYLIAKMLCIAFEYAETKLYDAISSISNLWQFDAIPDFKGKAEIEEMTREAFWLKVDEFEAKGGKVHPAFRNRPGHLRPKKTEN